MCSINILESKHSVSKASTTWCTFHKRKYHVFTNKTPFNNLNNYIHSQIVLKHKLKHFQHFYITPSHSLLILQSPIIVFTFNLIEYISYNEICTQQGEMYQEKKEIKYSSKEILIRLYFISFSSRLFQCCFSSRLSHSLNL